MNHHINHHLRHIRPSPVYSRQMAQLFTGLTVVMLFIGGMTGSYLAGKTETPQILVGSAGDGPGGSCTPSSGGANAQGCGGDDGCRAWEKCSNGSCKDTTNGGANEPSADSCGGSGTGNTGGGNACTAAGNTCMDAGTCNTIGGTTTSHAGCTSGTSCCKTTSNTGGGNACTAAGNTCMDAGTCNTIGGTTTSHAGCTSGTSCCKTNNNTGGGTQNGNTKCSDNCYSEPDGSKKFCYNECSAPGKSRKVSCENGAFVVDAAHADAECSDYGTTSGDGVVVCNNSCKSGKDGAEKYCYDECSPNRTGIKQKISCYADGNGNPQWKYEPICNDSCGTMPSGCTAGEPPPTDNGNNGGDNGGDNNTGGGNACTAAGNECMDAATCNTIGGTTTTHAGCVTGSSCCKTSNNTGGGNACTAAGNECMDAATCNTIGGTTTTHAGCATGASCCNTGSTARTSCTSDSNNDRRCSTLTGCTSPAQPIGGSGELGCQSGLLCCQYDFSTQEDQSKSVCEGLESAQKGYYLDDKNVCYFCHGGLKRIDSNSSAWGEKRDIKYCEANRDVCENKSGYRVVGGTCYKCYGGRQGNSFGYNATGEASSASACAAATAVANSTTTTGNSGTTQSIWSWSYWQRCLGEGTCPDIDFWNWFGTQTSSPGQMTQNEQ